MTTAQQRFHEALVKGYLRMQTSQGGFSSSFLLLFEREGLQHFGLSTHRSHSFVSGVNLGEREFLALRKWARVIRPIT